MASSANQYGQPGLRLNAFDAHSKTAGCIVDHPSWLSERSEGSSLPLHAALVFGVGAVASHRHRSGRPHRRQPPDRTPPSLLQLMGRAVSSRLVHPAGSEEITLCSVCPCKTSTSARIRRRWVASLPGCARTRSSRWRGRRAQHPAPDPCRRKFPSVGVLFRNVDGGRARRSCVEGEGDCAVDLSGCESGVVDRRPRRLASQLQFAATGVFGEVGLPDADHGSSVGGSHLDAAGRNWSRRTPSTSAKTSSTRDFVDYVLRFDVDKVGHESGAFIQSDYRCDAGSFIWLRWVARHDPTVHRAAARHLLC